MTRIKTRIQVTRDGTLTGRATGLPVGEHDVEVVLIETTRTATPSQVKNLLARVRAIQEEVARLPVLDARSPDAIIGYNEQGHLG